MKVVLIGSLAGLAIVVAVTLFYLSLATFFGAQAKALNAVQKAENARKHAAGPTAAQNTKKKKSEAHAG